MPGGRIPADVFLDGARELTEECGTETASGAGRTTEATREGAREATAEAGFELTRTGSEGMLTTAFASGVKGAKVSVSAVEGAGCS